MLILLPPSEGKAEGGRGAPLDLERMSYPSLTPTRRRVLGLLQDVARAEPEQLRIVLGLPEGHATAVAADACLSSSPPLPVLSRYTGVLYEALSFSTLDGSARRRAQNSLVVASALFGLLRPADRIPMYRLPGTTRLPGLGGSLAGVWRPVLEAELAGARGLVVDLRSGVYATLARVPQAVQVRVLREAGGVRTVVSHDNKWTKGRLARQLCVSGARTVADVAEAGRSLADAVEVDGRRVDLVLHGLATSREEPAATR